MNRLDEIEARTNAATEGPWEWEGEAKSEWEMGANSLIPSRRPDDPVLYGYGYDASGIKVENPADAEFIAHARQDVPALVAALRAVVAVHRPVTVPGEVFGTWGEAKQCEDCEQRWPCNTLDAIRRHLGEDQ